MEKEYPSHFRSGQASHTSQCECKRKKKEDYTYCQICMDKNDFSQTFKNIQDLEEKIREKKDTLISQVQIQTELEEQLRNIKQLIDKTKLEITLSENNLEKEKERIQLSSETVSDDVRVHTGIDVCDRTVLLETHCSIVRLLGSQENVYFGHVTLVITIYGVREYRWHYGVVVKNELPINLEHYFWKPNKNKYSEDNLVKTFGDFPHIPSDTKLSDMMLMHFNKCFTVFDKERWPTQVWDKYDKFGNETAIELVDRLKQQKIKMYQKTPNADSASLQEELAKAEQRIKDARKIKKEQRKKERDVRNQEIVKITKDRETQAQLDKERETLEKAQLARDREVQAQLAKDRETLEKAQEDADLIKRLRLEQSTRDKEREKLRKEQAKIQEEQAKIQNATLSSKKKRPKKPTQSTPVVDIDQIELDEASAYNKAKLIEKANETIERLSEKINKHTQVEQALGNLQIEDVNSVQEAKSSILDLLDNYYKYRHEINQRINELVKHITDYNEEPIVTLNNIEKDISTSIDRLKSLEETIIIEDATVTLRRLLEDIQSRTEEEKTLGVLPIEEAHSSMDKLLGKYYEYQKIFNYHIKLLQEKRYVGIDLYKELISANSTLLEAIQPLDYKFRFVDAKLLFIRDLKNRADYIKTGEDKLETLDHPATLEASNVRRSLINEYYKYNTAHNHFIDEVRDKNMPKEYEDILYKDAYDLKETANVTKRLDELIAMEIDYIRKMYENFSDEVNEDDDVIIANLAYLKLLSNEQAEEIVKKLKMRKQAKGKGKGKGKDIFFSTKDIISAIDKES